MAMRNTEYGTRNLSGSLPGEAARMRERRREAPRSGAKSDGCRRQPPEVSCPTPDIIHHSSFIIHHSSFIDHHCSSVSPLGEPRTCSGRGVASEALAAPTVGGDLHEPPPPAARPYAPLSRLLARGTAPVCARRTRLRRYAASPGRLGHRALQFAFSIPLRATSLRFAGLAVLIFSSALATANAQDVSDLFRNEVPAALSSRKVSIRFEKLGLADGLDQSTVFDIMQDHNGFIWLGTQGGLARYDGYELKSYRHEPFDETSLMNGWVIHIEPAADGGLWVSTSKGLDRMDPITESFTHFAHDPDDQTTIAGGAIASTFEAADGTLWIATWVNGLDKLEKGSTSITHFRHDSTDATSISDNQVHSIIEDSSGRLWIATRGGLDRMDPDRSGVFTRIVEGSVWPMLERPEERGVLWVGSRGSLIRVDAQTETFERFHPFPNDPERGYISGISQDPVNKNMLWVSVAGTGLARFDLRTKGFFIYEPDPEDPNSLSTAGTGDVFTDRSGMVWVSTRGAGVDRFNPATVGFEYFRQGSDSPGSLVGHGIWSILEDANGIIWAGTYDHEEVNRLTRLDRQSDTVTYFEHDPSDPYSLSKGSVHALFEDRTGVLWVGTSNTLSRLHRESGRFYHLKHDPSNPSSLSSSSIWSIFQDRSGTMWFGTIGGGLNRMDPDRPGEFTRYGYDENDPSTLSDRSVKYITEDQGGFIWMTHGGFGRGISRLDPVSGNVTRYRHDKNDPNSLGVDAVGSLLERKREPGVIWLATSGGGLDRLDVASGKFRHFTVSDGLPNNTLYGVLEDEEGRLWISTNNGLSRFDPETETFRNYGLEIGLQSLEFNSGAFTKSRDGEMFFGGINGVNAFFPNELSENSVAPEVAIVDLKLSNQSVKESGAVNLSATIPETREIRLKYDQTDIAFDYVALHFQNPEKNTFAYKLEGFNDDWVMAGDRRSASFTNLDPGEYTFRIKAANADGVWNEEGASIRLVVTPPFWATWWFRILTFLAIAGIVYTGYRARVEQISRRARELENEVDRRTQELQASNTQLEQSHTIVQAINQETSFRRLLTKILEESRVIPGVEKATALVHMPDDDRFHVRAASGWDVAAMQNILLTASEAHRRYVEQAERVAEDIYVAKDVGKRAGTEQMAEFGQVASFLVLRILVEERVVAYLVFDNLTDEDAFDQRDIELLERLRDHITSAFIKTRILDDLQTTLDSLQSTQDRLIQSEKMASLGQLTAGIAHEIKNPLNFVNNFSDVTAELAEDAVEELSKLKGRLPEDALVELDSIIANLSANAKKIAEHGKRADSIVQNMLEHSKVGEGERTPTKLNDLLDEYVTLAVHGLEARGGGFKVDVVREFDDAIDQVDLVPQDMGRVFMNLLSNAFDALKQHGSAYGEPKVTVSTIPTEGAVEIRVSDNGPGIPSKIKSKIFEPFFTTKPTGSGTGLGLSMSYDIVTKGHGGTLDVTSEEGKGATFIVRLPV